MHVLLDGSGAMRVVTSVYPGSSQGCAGEADLRSATNVGKRSGYGIEKGRPFSGTNQTTREKRDNTQHSLRLRVESLSGRGRGSSWGDGM